MVGVPRFELGFQPWRGCVLTFRRYTQMVLAIGIAPMFYPWEGYILLLDDTSKWCPNFESNKALFLTMEMLYHLTKRAFGGGNGSQTHFVRVTGEYNNRYTIPPDGETGGFAPHQYFHRVPAWLVSVLSPCRWYPLKVTLLRFLRVKQWFSYWTKGVNGGKWWSCTTRVDDSDFTDRPATIYGITSQLVELEPPTF